MPIPLQVATLNTGVVTVAGLDQLFEKKPNTQFDDKVWKKKYWRKNPVANTKIHIFSKETLEIGQYGVHAKRDTQK